MATVDFNRIRNRQLKVTYNATRTVFSRCPWQRELIGRIRSRHKPRGNTYFSSRPLVNYILFFHSPERLSRAPRDRIAISQGQFRKCGNLTNFSFQFYLIIIFYIKKNCLCSSFVTPFQPFVSLTGTLLRKIIFYSFVNIFPIMIFFYVILFCMRNFCLIMQKVWNVFTIKSDIRVGTRLPSYRYLRVSARNWVYTRPRLCGHSAVLLRPFFYLRI